MLDAPTRVVVSHFSRNSSGCYYLRFSPRKAMRAGGARGCLKRGFGSTLQQRVGKSLPRGGMEFRNSIELVTFGALSISRVLDCHRHALSGAQRSKSLRVIFSFARL